MWFARGDGKSSYHWVYHIPEDRHDGLPVGSINGTGLDTGLIHQLIDRIVNDTYKDVNSILLIKDGKLILEEYFYGFNADSLHELRSATKSFTSALIGIATDRGLLRGADQKIAPLFTGYDLGNDARKQHITIGDLLTQRSGLACDDDDDNSSGNETKIYPTGDWIKTILGLPMAGDPGVQASYCSGNVLLLDRIVEKASGQRLCDFAGQNLFAPLGIKKFKWDFVPDSTHQEDFGQLCLRPRDMAKFGLLYLNQGRWAGKEVISKVWIAASLYKHADLRGLSYGYLWWCENLQSNGKVFKGFAAKGNGGQRIFLWPDQHMLAVITAGNYNSQSPANQLLIECVLADLK
jgi:CubicO group peptidase (beta-lactamase class C family)